MKKLPAEPNGPSTSGKALAQRSKCELRGEAKHSKPTPRRARSSDKTGGPAAACEGDDEMEGEGIWGRRDDPHGWYGKTPP